MKFCVIGSGAIGGYLAVKLALSGQDVTVVARNRNLDAIRTRGIELLNHDGEHEARVQVSAVPTPHEAGAQDVVILAVKAHQVAPLVNDLAALVNGETVLIPMQNGIPWWYFQRLNSPYEGRTVESVDPGGVIARSIDPERIVGCVVYPAAELQAPGVVRHVEGTRFPIGELDGQTTEADLAALTAAGLKSPILPDVRSEIWLKLWGNLSFNPISALTHATLEDICKYPASRELARTMMLEAQAIAQKVGARFRVDVEQRIAGAEKVGAHKTSMLQDVESGREPEIDALLGSVIELGHITNTPTPALDAVYACVKLLAQVLTQHEAAVRLGVRDAASPRAVASSEARMPISE